MEYTIYWGCIQRPIQDFGKVGARARILEMGGGGRAW